MSVAMIVDDQWEVRRCVHWGARFARAAEQSLLVIVVNGGEGETKIEELSPDEKPTLVAAAVLDYVHQRPDLKFFQGDLQEAATPAELQAFDARRSTTGTFRSSSRQALSAQEEPATEQAVEPAPVRVVLMTAKDKSAALLQCIGQYGPSLLVLPRHRTERGLDSETPWESVVYRRAPCATMLLCPSEPDADAGERADNAEREGEHRGGVLAPVDDGRPSIISLRWAARMSNVLKEPLTALYVEPKIGDVANEVGRRIIDRVVNRSLGSDRELTRKVIVGESVRQTIHKFAAEQDFDLIVLGVNRVRGGRRWVKVSISEWLLGKETGRAAVAIVRPPLPLAHRFTTRLAEWLRDRVPQLDREARISLYERIQSSSRWDFDFIALICLSTLIAALGLVQSSPAVVIGAMLVAPLMTPLVGAGLALVQGNRILMVRAWGTVLRGFLLAFFIGFLVGWCVPGLQESSEMLARGSPTVLDLGVALIGGVAASYALGRPNLFSALPGVAIAAALVPPIATAGLAASLGNFPLAFGALLLFATNIVAIVLGTSISLFAVGVRASHEHGVVEGWVYRIAATLIVIISVIAAYEFVPHHALPASLQAELSTMLQEDANAKLHAARLASSDRVQLTVHCPNVLAPQLRSRLAQAVRAQLGQQVTLEIDTRLVTIDSPPP